MVVAHVYSVLRITIYISAVLGDLCETLQDVTLFVCYLVLNV